MTPHEKRCMRLTLAIHRQFTANKPTPVSVELPTATWRQGELLLRRMQMAHQRGWRLAAHRLQRELRETLRRLHGELIAVDRLLDPERTDPHTATVKDLYADLIALRSEFEKVSLDSRRRTISVTTEPIELEGQYLGPFEVRLDWTDLAGGHPNNYWVVAVDPHPAASNEGVTHPHVQDDAVCEGDGRPAIRDALQQGRLLDFFLIVANLLRTYNPGSPHVSLSDWHGVDCSDCGSRVGEDDRWTCEKCEAVACDDCYCNCAGCDGIFCNDCVTPCVGCDENNCGACMTRCSGCRAERCPDCLDDDERCANCHEEQTSGSDTESTGSGGQAHAGAAVQPDRVGEAAVPA